MKKDFVCDVVVQEVCELFVVMEVVLLQIEMEGLSCDSINVIFCVVYIIKGLVGLFVFDSIVQFMYQVEYVLDLVCEECLFLNVFMMLLLLQCGDYVSDLVDVIECNQEVEEFNVECCVMLLVVLVEVVQLVSVLGEVVSELVWLLQWFIGIVFVDVVYGGDVYWDVVLQVMVDYFYWYLLLQFNENVLCDGFDFLFFLYYLCLLGCIVVILLVEVDIFDVVVMDVESCYLGVEICLVFDFIWQMLEDVFEFVCDDSCIDILLLQSFLVVYVMVLQWFVFDDVVCLVV